MKDNFLFQPRKDLLRIQNRKLHHFIARELYPFSPYYRKLFDKNRINPNSIKTVQDLKNIPLTSKNDFFDPLGKDRGNRNLDFILQPNEESVKKYLPKRELIKGKACLKKRLEAEYTPIFLTATAGTTNQPVAFLYTNYDIENLRLYGKRIVDVFGLDRGSRAINVFPYAPHLAFWQTVFAGFASNMFILSTGGGKTIGTKGNLNFILKIKPQFLIGVSSYIYHILTIAKEQNLKLSFLKNIALGASRVPKGFKKKISSLLTQMGARDVKILGTYGFTESRSAWAECPTDIDITSGYHIYPDKEVFEVIDPATGEVKGEGEDGELVYTNIDSRGSCVLRYRTGDLVKGGIVYSPCPYCKRTVPRISSDITRASNIKDIQLSKIKGALVNLNTLEHLLDDEEGVDEWQIEITKKNNDPYEVDELVLYISLLRNLNKQKFQARLNQKIFPVAEVSFNRINFVTSREIRRRIGIESGVKAMKIVDRREKK
ncbi:MAG: AMP-binding protein [Candidatus Omnitrophota bacterium]|nr:AMP-binding protein [Candidatus Omnitrophota bacterium]